MSNMVMVTLTEEDRRDGAPQSDALTVTWYIDWTSRSRKRSKTRMPDVLSMEKEPPALSTREYVTMRPGPAKKKEQDQENRDVALSVCLQMLAGRNDDGTTIRDTRYYPPMK